MRLILTLCALSILGTGLVAAQINQNPTYETPPERQMDTSLCHSKMVAALYEATDIADPSQDSHLKAAEAYRLLDQAGQRCE